MKNLKRKSFIQFLTWEWSYCFFHHFATHSDKIFILKTYSKVYQDILSYSILSFVENQLNKTITLFEDVYNMWYLKIMQIQKTNFSKHTILFHLSDTNNQLCKFFFHITSQARSTQIFSINGMKSKHVNRKHSNRTNSRNISAFILLAYDNHHVYYTLYVSTFSTI